MRVVSLILVLPFFAGFNLQASEDTEISERQELFFQFGGKISIGDNIEDTIKMLEENEYGCTSKSSADKKVVYCKLYSKNIDDRFTGAPHQHLPTELELIILNEKIIEINI